MSTVTIYTRTPRALTIKAEVKDPAFDPGEHGLIVKDGGEVRCFVHYDALIAAVADACQVTESEASKSEESED